MKLIVVLVSTLVLMSCGNDQAPDPCASNNPPPSCLANNGKNNACVPLTECSPDACGDIDDTCGGVLDCGSCPCDGTTVVEVACGPCGIGVRSCDDTPTGSCLIPGKGALDAITDETCTSDLIYVNLTAANDGDGTPNSPRNNLQEALSQAVGDGAIAVLVGASADTPVLDSPLALVNGIHVLGGFDASLSRTSEPTRFRVAATDTGTSDSYSLGLVAKGLQDTTLFSGFDVEVDDALTWSIGVQVDTSPGLLMQRVSIKAGSGGSGTPGMAGQDGEAGDDGQSGNPGTIGERFAAGGVPVDGVPGGMCNSGASRVASGYGGCGQDALDNGSTLFFCSERGGGDGETIGDSDGGTPSQNPSSRDGDNGRSFSDAATPGMNGFPGANWNEDGTLGLWVPDVSAGNGTGGIDGDAGPAGAGGGGGFAELFMSNSSCGGGGGGSGGTGGCPGTGGGGGTAGWPSIGALVRSSEGAVFDEVTVVAGNGGDGGAGGIGGDGGTGGNGGQGARFCTNGSTIDRGGDGGDGADGQVGGTGGGGAGGDSFGLLCIEHSFANLAGIDAIAGTPGNGGLGGTAAPSGFVESVTGCDSE